MTEQEPRPGRRSPRRGTILVTAIVVVAIVAGLAIALGGGLGTTTPTPTPGDAGALSPAFTDLPLVAVPPTTAAATPRVTVTVAPASGSGSASPSGVATVPADAGVRANRIRIARLGIDLKIVEGDGIDAPIGKAAHYPGSAWPGAGSNVYIYGHAREGMFLSLWKAREGDTIELDLVDGTTRTYVVDKVLPKVPWDAMKYVRPTKTEQLTLQTST